jgi:hypothetical protein
MQMNLQVAAVVLEQQVVMLPLLHRVMVAMVLPHILLGA